MKIDFKKLAKLFWVAAFFIGVVGFNFSPVAKAGLDSDNNNNGKVVICSLGVACGQTINTNVTYSPSATVKAGDQLTINVVFNRAVLDSPAPQISMAGQYTVAATNMTKVDTTHYTFIHNVPNDAIDGTESITISNVDDGFYDSLNGTPHYL